MGKNVLPNGRAKAGRFVGIPFSVLDSPQGKALKHAEKAFLIDLLLQYTGSNNGMLSPCFALMSEYGWATSSLHRAKKGLIDKGFLVVTRQGKKIKGVPTLVAVTWRGIDEPRKTLVYDDGIKPDATPLNYWKNQKHKPP